MTLDNTEIIGKRIARIYELLLYLKKNESKSLGITPNDYNYFLTIHRNPGCTQNFLAQKRKVDKSLVTRIVNKYEAKGFIYKKENAENKSAYSLFLTNEGEKIENQIEQFILEINHAIQAKYTTKEFNDLLNQLDRLSEFVEELT